MLDFLLKKPTCVKTTGPVTAETRTLSHEVWGPCCSDYRKPNTSCSLEFAPEKQSSPAGRDLPNARTDFSQGKQEGQERKRLSSINMYQQEGVLGKQERRTAKKKNKALKLKNKPTQSYVRYGAEKIFLFVIKQPRKKMGKIRIFLRLNSQIFSYFRIFKLLNLTSGKTFQKLCIEDCFL